MIKISDLKEGDFLIVDKEGTLMEGCVTAVDNAQKMAKISTGEGNEFWYEIQALAAIPLSDDALRKLHFEKIEEEDGGVKYKKGAFRVHLQQKDDFNDMDFWYREDRRHVKAPLALHELQNHYLSMTKVHLTDAPI
jgi:intein/homing endonuclease